MVGSWFPFKFGRGEGIKISHLFVVDDILLVAEASYDQVMEVRHILEIFCAGSGQKINHQKSMVFFSNNVSPTIADSLSGSLGIPSTHDLGTCLGIPIVHHRFENSLIPFWLIEFGKSFQPGNLDLFLLLEESHWPNPH